ncbi:hypothetical protein VOLCADRAFT_74188 [Volvox carteri f. nagariensis]|uniref:hydroxyacylglutathione hydrolase n=1 Tax=Volvox carteri f. nagariensis TaxID=3068 RepID=D8TSI9_VOLCA|nr:uncharacterized protein VOLCADRAFT_74188 [Volvox carteri f. nagariensis]EFJ49495.1 hypothetical protein VOLCADRAFT_74188 [Volvox carteri f. nagariensis]|eukprot:XP_002949476.1 hypothetical protein VOLCADRAFT_74188 [Volvox carteri f. nagariensis]
MIRSESCRARYLSSFCLAATTAASAFPALCTTAAIRGSATSNSRAAFRSCAPPRCTRGTSTSTRTHASTADCGPMTGDCGALEVVRVPCLSDNYVWLLREPTSGRTAVVDPAELHPVVSELERRGWVLDAILNTHHHWDHVGANLDLKRRFPSCDIVGPRADKDRIPGIEVQVGEGDSWHLGSLEVRVFDTPGHTRGHITYWVPQAGALFPGDTLFALGCGRLFEGSPRQMWSSLSKLLALPDHTRVYCAHEYTAANARFAMTVDPDNPQLADRKMRVDAARAKGEATVPSTLGEEKATNPFLRPGAPSVRKNMGLGPAAEDWEVFAAVRAAKDRF